MKTLLSLLITTQLLAFTSFAEPSDVVLEVLKHNTSSETLSVEKDTYVFNIHGYACQWPGIKISRMNLRADLNHSSIFGSDDKRLAVGIKNPNHQFCESFGGAQDVFGNEFTVGAKLPIKIHRVLDLRKRNSQHSDGTPMVIRLIRETITIQINGRTVEAAAEINLGPIK